MPFWKRNNAGVGIDPKFLYLGSQVTAGTTYDNVLVTSSAVDRLGFDSAQVTVLAKTTLTTAKALNCTVSILDSADNDTYSSAVTLYSGAVASGLTTGDLTAYEINVNLAGYERYVKFELTPDLTNSGTDTGQIALVVNLCGADSIPVA